MRSVYFRSTHPLSPFLVYPSITNPTRGKFKFLFFISLTVPMQSQTKPMQKQRQLQCASMFLSYVQEIKKEPFASSIKYLTRSKKEERRNALNFDLPCHAMRCVALPNLNRSFCLSVVRVSPLKLHENETRKKQKKRTNVKMGIIDRAYSKREMTSSSSSIILI